MMLFDVIGSPIAATMLRTWNKYTLRWSVRQFEKFLGHAATVEEISDALLLQFRGWLIETRPRSFAISTTSSIRRLTHLIRPEDFPDRPRLDEHPDKPGWSFALREKPPQLSTAAIASLASSETRIDVAYWHIYYPRVGVLQSPRTRKLYLLALDRLNRYLGRHATLADLNDETVIGWLGHCGEEGISPQSVNIRRDKLLALWRFLACKRIVPEFPQVPPVREPRPIPLAWTEDQLVQLLDACRAYTDPEMSPGVNGPGWWVALHMVAYDTGARAGELLALRWDWLDSLTGDLAVPAHVRKGRQQPMLYRLQGDTLAAVANIREPARELIFPVKSLNDFYYRYRRLMKAAGLPADRRSKIHRMRRSHASHLEAVSPGAATDSFGHSSRKVTMAYLDTRICQRTKPSDLLPRPWAKKGGGAA